ncbi:amino acid ABC transporter membrane protein 2, PAAT family [Terribacillus aidingensis]|uniref:Amino acid ABC transporter membrane protein 2, PAAT family n=1 Tax=Terribacillus aidingensis TaxID=586416 RepID=A0A285NL21_9BACI|nr:ABC transporter permease subunit [Terribacillus aidingensis]SNZ10192.1 amino acid ABC transporter membrane protein 2, PAAT family [Terribacillus aidingensis]
MDFDFAFMLEAFLAALHYLPTTLLLGFLPLVFGSALGLAIALIRHYEIPILAVFFKWFVTIFKAVPVVLILLVSYLVFSDVLDKIANSLALSISFRDIDRRSIAIFALTLYATSGLSEIFRGAFASIPKGQIDAAYSVGLTTLQVLRRVMIPQVIPLALPLVNNMLISLIKASSLVSMVSVVDILNGAVIEANVNYRYLEAYVAVSIIYWGVCASIEAVTAGYEKYANRNRRRQFA